jgi:hypothetical protein
MMFLKKNYFLSKKSKNIFFKQAFAGGLNCYEPVF